MVINFTLDNKKYAAVQTAMQGYLHQSETLRQTLTDLADRDVEAFQAVSACYTMPRSSDAEKATRTAALQAALKVAAQVPFTVAQHCLAVMQLAEPVGRDGNANVVSDAATALYLAQAALLSALVNVNINLKLIKDADFVATWSNQRDELLARAAQAYQSAKSACETTLGVNL
jgi:formiminotetrahydrofolate cyclodeaminase